MGDLTIHERSAVLAAIDRYISDIARACEEDQGVRQGRPGTLGYEVQLNLRVAKVKLQLQ